MEENRQVLRALIADRLAALRARRPAELTERDRQELGALCLAAEIVDPFRSA